MLFRTSSLTAARSFTTKGVQHPHGNVLSADAFARGVIRSGTDFSVFAKGIPGEKAGMAGIDFAFYRNRAYYHTPFDSIPGMGRGEGRKALWAMMETVRGAGLELLNGTEIDDNGDTGVYFDGALSLLLLQRSLPIPCSARPAYDRFLIADPFHCQRYPARAWSFNCARLARVCLSFN